VKTYIKDLVANDEVTSFFLSPELPTVRKSKKDTDYLVLKLIDKTGEIDARVWQVPRGFDPKSVAKKIVKIKGTVSEWNEQKQLSISAIRPIVDADNVDMEDFFEASPFPIEEMWSELMRIVGSLDNSHVRQLLFNLLKANETAFKKSPAAKSVHHGFIGGLLEHSLSLCKTGDLLSVRYGLDRNLMIAAGVLHDLGKCFELSCDMGTSYTVKGTLLGHLVIGLLILNKAMDEDDSFPDDLRMTLLHIIEAHHGRLEFGSPKTPLTKEALAFHLCDMLDSQLAIFDRMIKGGINEDNVTEWCKELGGPLYVLPKE
jgi:3'-5' exoribonuclease